MSERLKNAEIAQLVEHNLAKVGVASSSLVFRSIGQHLAVFFVFIYFLFYFINIKGCEFAAFNIIQRTILILLGIRPRGGKCLPGGRRVVLADEEFARCALPLLRR